MTLHGRQLVELMLRLEDIETELAQMCDWLDQQDGGNGRTCGLLDQAALLVAGAIRQAQRDIAASDLRVQMAQLDGREQPV